MSRDSLTAWVYARRSLASENQASVTDQKDHGRDAVTASGWTLGGILEEEVSASRYARKAREAWPALLELIAAGKVGVLILWEASRGDRKLAEWAAFLELCQENGVLIHVISHEHTYNLANHRDWKTLASEGVESDHYTRRLSADTRRGKRGAMRRGRPQGPPPFGYRVRYDERTGKTAGWDVVEGQDDAVRRIVRGVGRHVPNRQLAREANADGILSPTGGEWTAAAVRNVAWNPSYAGLIRLPDGTLKERDPAYPPIVERHEWEAADAVLRPRARGSRPNAALHMMAGISGCPCGGTMESYPFKGCYRCSGHAHNYVPMAWLDERVGYLVCARLAQDDARDLYADDSGERTAALEAELAPLLARRERYRAAAADGDEDADDILARLKPRIARLERQAGEVRYVPALRDILTVPDVFAAWEGYTVQARREVIRAVTGITVLRVPRSAPRAERYDPARIVPDWEPQPLRPPGRQGLRITRNA